VRRQDHQQGVDLGALARAKQGRSSTPSSRWTRPAR
jgi:hypothetical protein